LLVGVALVPAFILWVGRQEKLGRPAVIPNSLWRNRVFTAICINVFITWGTFNAAEQLLTFVFQDVQKVSAIKASVYFLPAPIAGTTSNIIIGLIAHKVNADKPVLIGNVLAGISPLILAVMNENASYWAFSFPAIALNAVGADVLFTVANLVIAASFPEKTQALAGGVFNTVAQIGKTVGLATSAVIASSATANTPYHEKESPPALMAGFRAAFWYCFGLCVITIGVNFWGLRKIGKVGAKKD
jgi:Na+/melibiose symporter-like transporter